MITCNYYEYEGKQISKDQLYNLLLKTLDEDATIEEVLFSRADKQNGRTKILESLKKQGNLDSKKGSSLTDVDVSYSGENGEYSISSFIDSP